MINGMRINYELVKPGVPLNTNFDYTCLGCDKKYDRGEYRLLQDVPFTLVNRCKCGATSWDVNEL